mgnify:FL=1
MYFTNQIWILTYLVTLAIVLPVVAGLLRSQEVTQRKLEQHRKINESWRVAHADLLRQNTEQADKLAQAARLRILLDNQHEQQSAIYKARIAHLDALLAQKAVQCAETDNALAGLQTDYDEQTERLEAANAAGRTLANNMAGTAASAHHWKTQYEQLSAANKENLEMIDKLLRTIRSNQAALAASERAATIFLPDPKNPARKTIINPN